MQNWKTVTISACLLMPACYCVAFIAAVYFGAPLKPFNPGEGIGVVFIFITTPIFVGINVIAGFILAQRLAPSAFSDNVYLAGCLIAPFTYAVILFVSALFVGGTIVSLATLLGLPEGDGTIILVTLCAWLGTIIVDVRVLKGLASSKNME